MNIGRGNISASSRPASLGKTSRSRGSRLRWKIGDRLQFDEVHIEVTAPESLVGARGLHGNQTFFCCIRESKSQWFLRESLKCGSDRPWREGVLTQSAFDVTVKAMLNANYGHPSRDVLETLVAAPIDARSRKKFEQALSTMG